MNYRKVYVGLPMDHAVVTALRVLQSLEIEEGEYRVEYSMGISTLYVVTDKAGMALDGLIEARILTRDDAWTYFVSSPVAFH